MASTSFQALLKQRTADLMSTCTSRHCENLTAGDGQDRIVFRCQSANPGPTTVLIACMHGNEPMALEALHRVVPELQQAQQRGLLRGSVIGLIGNVSALTDRRRYIDEDLNRAFRYDGDTHPQLRLALDRDSIEHGEATALVRALREIVASAHKGYETHVIDMHTFSSLGTPFVVLSDTLRNRALARCWPVPRVLGLAERLPGTLTQYLTACGCVSVVLETGQHNDPRSVDLHEAAIRLAVVHAGHVASGALGDAASERTLLSEAAGGAPRVIEIPTRHGIESGDGFRMRDGFANFDKVRQGDILADSAAGPVAAERSGRILLPLYQQQGADGYFIGRPIWSGWLLVSWLARHLGLARLTRFLPGVRSGGMGADRLIMRRRVTRWFARDIMHLLGYHVEHEDAQHIVVTRHHWDRSRPPRIHLG